MNCNYLWASIVYKGLTDYFVLQNNVLFLRGSIIGFKRFFPNFSNNLNMETSMKNTEEANQQLQSRP